jgi:hypothetical protein
MSASLIALRLVTFFLLLAGILLLRKPVFGQSVTSAPTTQQHTVSDRLSAVGQSFPIMDTHMHRED